MKEKKYKLYNNLTGYRCKVNAAEIIFLFGVEAVESVEAVNKFLKDHNTNYYITD